ncbi:aromatic acid exporter family protein [Rhodococcus sp. BL-253-APC-6A1W]|uniref:FUSC family protein n=1 Tax=unclassified Rhodococcus (in: high G+C Gram-positive bacteria) TaxID=192944 RepID=UPI00146B2332|nr:FUSC family protein [Rhodococcus sp. BL-253-APC-6A1W]NMD93916.1 aromatic acid exporter family protein [Rhodococcus sp. BL-253-APC-6A1W]
MASSRRFPSRAGARERLKSSGQRLRSSALPIVQCALAAGLAWWVAKDVIHHGTPFFAPIAAVVSLGLSLGARLRRSVELVCGVTVGIGVGDLIVSLIGSGPWQIALVVAMAMATAVALNSGPIFAIQAGNSAVLVATLLPPGEAGGFDRMVDALVGGLVGVAVVALVPTHPVRRARRNAAEILGTAADVLRKVEAGLVENNPKPIEEALRQARATQQAIDTMRTHLKGGREISRISPLYWNSRKRLAVLTAAADPIDHAMRNVRVLTRRSLTLVRDDEILDPRLVSQFDQLADAVDVLREMVLAEPGDQPDQAAAARVLRRAAKRMSPDLVEGAGVSATVVFAQMRSLLVDLLQVAGLKRISAIATLPPTVERPAYEPES